MGSKVSLSPNIYTLNPILTAVKCVAKKQDILRQIKVKNLDTGEEMDLVEAEDQLPPSINPLSLHIMRLTSEYVSGDRSNVRHPDSDTESMVSSVSGYTIG